MAFQPLKIRTAVKIVLVAGVVLVLTTIGSVVLDAMFRISPPADFTDALRKDPTGMACSFDSDCTTACDCTVYQPKQSACRRVCGKIPKCINRSCQFVTGPTNSTDAYSAK